MFRRLVSALVMVGTILAGGAALAQRPFPVNIVPNRTSLDRLGLERQWFGVVPLVETERLLAISVAGKANKDDRPMLFAQTSYAMLHAFDAESGQLIWSAQLGERTGFARGVAANSFAVFVSNADTFFALDKKTGRPIWRHDLDTIPTSSPAATEELAMLGLTTGKIYAFALKSRDEKGKATIRTAPEEAWNWQAGGPMKTRPMPFENVTVFASNDGKAYVVMSNQRTNLFRFGTGAAIGAGMGTYKDRTLLIPSADNNLYAVDLFTTLGLWTFPSGSPIDQEPLVAGNDIYITNTAGYLSSLDPATGIPKWTRSTQGGQTAGISATKLYLRSYNLDLFIIDRKTGRVLVDPGETLERAGLDLREFDLSIVNRFNDRLYFATTSGLILCLRETGQLDPLPLKDPNDKPFGYVPPEGIKPPPPPTSTVEEAKPEAGAEPGADVEKKEPGDGEKKEPAEAEKKEDADTEKEKPAADDMDKKKEPEADKDEPK